MMNDVVSVIIPVYNTVSRINKCYRSIANQTYTNLEIIFIDDGSTDGSAEILDDIALRDTRVKVIHQENLGVSAARNRGLDEASGEWLTFVDSDDVLAESAIGKLLSKYGESHDVIIFGKSSVDEKGEVVNHSGSPYLEDMTLSWKGCLLLFSSYKDICFGPVGMNEVWGKLVRCSTLVESNARFREDISFYEDAVFSISLLSYARNAVVVFEPLYLYQRRSDSLTLNVYPGYSRRWIDGTCALLEELARQIRASGAEKEILSYYSKYAFYLLYRMIFHVSRETEGRKKWIHYLFDSYFGCTEMRKLLNGRGYERTYFSSFISSTYENRKTYRISSIAFLIKILGDSYHRFVEVAKSFSMRK